MNEIGSVLSRAPSETLHTLASVELVVAVRIPRELVISQRSLGRHFKSHYEHRSNIALRLRCSHLKSAMAKSFFFHSRYETRAYEPL